MMITAVFEILESLYQGSFSGGGGGHRHMYGSQLPLKHILYDIADHFAVKYIIHLLSGTMQRFVL